jgi:hypothetical protein
MGGSSAVFGFVECAWRGGLPKAHMLCRFRPNPVRGNAVIAFDLPKTAPVTLTVYDISGRMVRAVGRGMAAHGIIPRPRCPTPGTLKINGGVNEKTGLEPVVSSSIPYRLPCVKPVLVQYRPELAVAAETLEMRFFEGGVLEEGVRFNRLFEIF